jgi:Domain of unknown function (DUF397)
MARRDLSQAVWRKSAYSGGTSNCVEVAGNLPATVAVRDSKDPEGPALTFGHHAWKAFTGHVKSGKYYKGLGLPPGGDPAGRVPSRPVP